MKIMNIDINTYLQNLLEWLNQIMTIELFVKITVLYFIILWIFIIFWVIRDSSDRSNSFIFQAFSILLVTIGTPIGILIYLLIRPPKTLLEKYNEEVEANLSELDKIIEKKKKEIQKQEEKLEKLKQEKKEIKKTKAKTTRKKKTDTKKEASTKKEKNIKNKTKKVTK